MQPMKWRKRIPKKLSTISNVQTPHFLRLLGDCAPTSSLQSFANFLNFLLADRSARIHVHIDKLFLLESKNDRIFYK